MRKTGFYIDFIILPILLIFCFAEAGGTASASDKPTELQGVGITEHLGRQINIRELIFRDEQNKSVKLANYFKNGKPVILTLVYFKCPMLCNLVLNGVLDSIKALDWNIASQFEIITVSINPLENAELAAKKKSSYLKSYNRRGAEQGWHFLTGDKSQIESLATQIGFQYRYDPKENQYFHAAAIYVLTPQGKVSRYLYGTTFKPQNLKLSLLEASNGTVATTTVDQILLFCFHFDPNKNSYTLRLWRIVQLVVCIQVLVLAIGMGFLWKKDHLVHKLKK